MASSIFVLGSFVVACSAKVARFPAAGESLRADMLTVEPGGKGFNLAVGAVRLGAAVDGLMAIGDDPLSVFAAPALRRAGLPLTMLKQFPGATGGGVGFTDATGENCLAVHAGANLSLSAQDVGSVADALRQAGLVLAQFEIADAPIIEAFRLARQAGIRTLLNPSPFRAVKPEILANTSILIVNASEASALAEALPPASNSDAAATEDERLAHSILQHGPDTLVVTRGNAGAIAFRKGEPALRQPAFAIEAVDSLGAGDAFAAGLAASLVAGLPFKEALRRAAACGALVTQRVGVFEALPTATALQDFLHARG
ncbi:ribokinase [Bosea caraganae]|uniref:Ribokinase n=1 Tax=Bosea caraganae TaxID=2763117 RepID=A0A370L6Q3_9HYPH|nr:ribokinase [Bosea caraganae]RDJ25437.1 ribokinase [Bosea caraganae]RDJ25778.1 ribokinase [Bosea caraganae]